MTELQEQALRTAKNHVSAAYKLLLHEATKPEECCRIGTHSASVLAEISAAENWLGLVIEDRADG